MCQEVHQAVSMYRAAGYNREDAWRVHEMRRREGAGDPIIGRGVFCHYWAAPLAPLTTRPVFEGATHELKESFSSYHWRVQLLEENRLLNFWRWVSQEGVAGSTPFDLAELAPLPGAYDGALAWRVITRPGDLLDAPSAEVNVPVVAPVDTGREVHLSPGAEPGGGAVVAEAEREGTDWVAWDKAVERLLSNEREEAEEGPAPDVSFASGDDNDSFSF